MDDETSFSALPNGLPDTLLAIERGIPRALLAIPNFNRLERRAFASFLRKKWKAQKSDDTDLILKWLADPEARRGHTWLYFDELEEGDEHHGPQPIDVCLLRRIRHENDLFAFDPDRFGQACEGWNLIRTDLVAHTKRPFERISKTALKFLNLWPDLERQLRVYSELDPVEAERVAHAIFALSSLTGSVWFLNRGLTLGGAIRRHFVELLEHHRVEFPRDIDAVQETNAEAVSVASDAWNHALLPPDISVSADLFGRGPHARLGDRLAEVGIALTYPTDRWPDLDAMGQVLEAALDVVRSQDRASIVQAQLGRQMDSLETMCAQYEANAALRPLVPALSTMVAVWKQHCAALPSNAIGDTTESLERYSQALVEKTEVAACLAAQRDMAADAVIAARVATSKDSLNFALRRELANRQGEEGAAETASLEAHEELLYLLSNETVASYIEGNGLASAPMPVTPDAAGEPTTPIRPSAPVEIEAPTVDLHTPMDRATDNDTVEPKPSSATRTLPISSSETPELESVRPQSVPPEPPIQPALEPKLRDAIWRALFLNDAASAYQIAHLTEMLGRSAVLPSALAKAIALSDVLLIPEAEVAQELREALASVDPDSFEGSDVEIHAQYLLLLSALFRPLLLAPDSTAPDLAARLRLPPGVTKVYELFSAFTDATARIRHYRLDARAFAAIRDEGAWQGEMQRLLEEIKIWRERAQHVRIKFHAATEIWHQWQKGGGEIDQLLAPIQKSEVAAVSAVRAQRDRLADAVQLTDLVDSHDRKLKRRGETIHGDALEQLKFRVGEACALASRWLALLDAKPASGGRGSHLDEIRHALMSRRAEALAELKVLENNSNPLIAASARVAAVALNHTARLFEPISDLPNNEPSVQHLLGRPLLAQLRIRLNYNWRLETDLDEARQVIADSIGQPASLEKVCDARISRGDIIGATRIVEILAVEEPAAAAAARARLEPATRELWQGLTRDLQHLSESIEFSVVYGLINETERDKYDERLRWLEASSPDLAQLEPTQNGVLELRGELESVAGRRKDELARMLAEVKQQADVSDFAIVERALAVNDLPSANEYLSRIQAGERLCDDLGASRDTFVQIYGTSLVSDIDAFLSDTGRNPKSWTQQVESGRAIGALAYEDISENARKDAVRMLGFWLELKRSAVGGVGDSDQRQKPLQALLRLFGFSNVRVPRPNASSRDLFEADFECDPIGDRDICPIPYFGSLAQGRYRLIFFPDRTSADQIVARIGPTVTSRPTIVLFFGRLTERQRRELSAEARAKRRSFLTIDEILLTFLTAERGSRLPALFGATLPLTWSDPYVTTASVVPPELFFGRHDERHRLLDPMGACFVYGGRQLGKTALLKHAERNFHAPENKRYAAYIDLKAAHIGLSTEIDSRHVWRPIHKKLLEIGFLPDTTPEPKINSRGKVDEFVDRMEAIFRNSPALRLLLLLDEADRFLEGDARHDYLETTRLKRLMEQTGRRFKVVLAGLHNVLRTAEQANHPLAHFGEPIEVGPLISRKEWREAQQLVHGPLAAAGFTFEREGMADRILAQTNFYPSLIQLYCSKLIGRMMEDGRFSSHPRYVIKESKLNETYLAKDLREEIRQKFRLTLQLDPRYAVIAYAIAQHSYEKRLLRAGSFKVADLTSMARSWWPSGFERTTEHGFRIIFEEMVGLGVLRKNEDGTFTLRNQNLLLLMGTADEVSAALLADRDLPEEFAAAEFHPILESQAAIAGRHPLTMAQLGALTSRDSGVVLIGGTPAAGVDRLLEALSQEVGGARVLRLSISSDERAFAKEIRAVVDKAGDGITVALVATESAWASRWIDAANDALGEFAAKSRYVKIVFVVGPDDAMHPDVAELVSRSDVLWQTLAPWSDGFVRQWLEERSQANGPEERARLKRRSEFWPLLLEPGELKTPIARFTGAHVDLRKVVHELATYAGQDVTASLGTQDVAALADLSVERVTDVLRVGERLGILVPAERGTFRVEPGLVRLIATGAVACE
jgi:hypothetical protein